MKELKGSRLFLINGGTFCSQIFLKGTNSAKNKMVAVQKKLKARTQLLKLAQH